MESSPARLVYHLLTPWFRGPARSRLRYIDLPFNIQAIPEAATFRQRCASALAELGPLTNARIVAFIYTHTHDEEGDLFYGNGFSSEDVAEWWKEVITTKLTEFATTGDNELYFAFLVCGKLLLKDVTRKAIIDVIDKSRAKHAFAFSTAILQPSLTTRFFYAFLHRVLIEGTSLTENNMATLLDQSVFIARHTPLWHFFRETSNNTLTVCKYRWFHNTMRPDGEDIGLQCPGCGSLASRVGKKKEKETAGGKLTRWVVVSCKMKDCTWHETYDISEEIRDLKTGENGFWTSRTFNE